jgi:hypothetical protein
MRPSDAMLILLALLTWGCRVQLPGAADGRDPDPVYAYVAGSGVARAVVKHDKAAAAQWLSYLKKSIDPEELSSLLVKGALETAALPGSRLRLTANPEKSGGVSLRLFTSSFGVRMRRHAGPVLFLNVLFQLRGAGGKKLHERKLSCLAGGRIVPAGLLPPLGRWAPSDDALPLCSRDMPSAFQALGRWCGAVVTETLIHDLHL